MSALACTIADTELAYDSEDTPVPVPGVLVTAVPAIAGPIFQLDDLGHHLLDVSAGRSVMTGLETGAWSITLPGPTFTSPAACPWIITLSDGRGFAGTVPDAAGPFSIYDLIHDHQWVELALPTRSISGPRGVPGPTGAQGDTGDQGVPGAPITATTTTAPAAGAADDLPGPPTGWATITIDSVERQVPYW